MFAVSGMDRSLRMGYFDVWQVFTGDACLEVVASEQDGRQPERQCLLTTKRRAVA